MSEIQATEPTIGPIEYPASVVEPQTIELLERAQLDVAIVTAKRYPRSTQAFRNELMQLATLNQAVARECIYALPREGKMIEGPSVRFAEILAAAWGNCRAAARVVEIGDKYVTAQGVFFDLQRNHLEATEVKRRITRASGARYSDDMIGVVSNAACAIARRNAILAGVPKALWSDIYQRVQATIAGDIATLEARRERAMAEAERMGLRKEQVFQLLGVKGIADVGLDQFVTLAGVLNSLRDGETTLEKLAADLAAQAKAEADMARAERVRSRIKAAAPAAGPDAPASPQ